MSITPTDFGASVPIDGYGPGFFRVGGEVWQGAILLCEAQVMPWGGLSDTDALAMLEDRADLLLIGTGKDIAHAPEALLDAAELVGLRCEVMASPPAARSYNVLLSEGRRVAAALIPV